MSLKIYHLTLFLHCSLLLVSCRNSVSGSDSASYQLKFLDEQIFSNDSIFSNTIVGGLSGIDYDPDSGVYYLICDDAKNPRFYKVKINIDKNHFSEIVFQSFVSVIGYEKPLQTAKVIDLESIRKFGDQLLLSSEGSIKHSINPSIFMTDTLGNYQNSFQLPSYFMADSLSENRPRHNAVFEGLTLDKEKTGFWAATELPLVNDGLEPTFMTNGAPARITHFNAKTKKADTQFAYPLDKLEKDPKEKFGVNGITSLIQIETNLFLVLERGYSAGYGNQGNTVRIYLVDTAETTNTLDIPVLQGKTIQPARKTLLFDFESVRSALTFSTVDNLEGMTLGPILSNGNPSLILVSDNNFNPPEEQLNQFILLELITP